MMLARCWCNHRSGLIADFQQFYNMNLLDYERDLSGDEVTENLRYVALLCANLPEKSRCVRKFVPALRWSDEAYLLADVVDILNNIRWMFSEDGSNGNNKPQPLKRPAQIEADTQQIEGTDFDFVDAVLGGNYGEAWSK